MKTLILSTIAACSIFSSINSYAFDEKFAKAVFIDQVKGESFILPPGEFKIAVFSEEAGFRKSIESAIASFNSAVGEQGYTAVIVPNAEEANLVLSFTIGKYKGDEPEISRRFDSKTQTYKGECKYVDEKYNEYVEKRMGYHNVLRKLFWFAFGLNPHNFGLQKPVAMGKQSFFRHGRR